MHFLQTSMYIFFGAMLLLPAIAGVAVKPDNGISKRDTGKSRMTAHPRIYVLSFAHLDCPFPRSLSTRAIEIARSRSSLNGSAIIQGSVCEFERANGAQLQCCNSLTNSYTWHKYNATNVQALLNLLGAPIPKVGMAGLMAHHPGTVKQSALKFLLVASKIPL
ncbi:hypothetical protein B0H34DRAFT_675980 [Crassisporium funariophilum]|nr:hypothetical protein B0H34DRAFT_675980 [Crassisporium funariophilum]